MVSAGGMMLVVAEMVAHLRLERGLQHLLGELVQQASRADQLDSLLPRLREELLGQLLLIHSRHSCRRSFVFCCGCCHVTDRVSHGLSPLGFRPASSTVQPTVPGLRGDNVNLAGHVRLVVCRTSAKVSVLSRVMPIVEERCIQACSALAMDDRVCQQWPRLGLMTTTRRSSPLRESQSLPSS